MYCWLAERSRGSDHVRTRHAAPRPQQHAEEVVGKGIPAYTSLLRVKGLRTSRTQKRNGEQIAEAASAVAAVKKCGAGSIPGIVAHFVVDFYASRWPLTSLLGTGGCSEAAPKVCRSASTAPRARLAACCSRSAPLETAAKNRVVAWRVRGGFPAATSSIAPLSPPPSGQGGAIPWRARRAAQSDVFS